MYAKQIAEHIIQHLENDIHLVYQDYNWNDEAEAHRKMGWPPEEEYDDIDDKLMKICPNYNRAFVYCYDQCWNFLDSKYPDVTWTYDTLTNRATFNSQKSTVTFQIKQEDNETYFTIRRKDVIGFFVFSLHIVKYQPDTLAHMSKLWDDF